MRVNAEAELIDLAGATSTTASRFKMRADQRCTPIGRRIFGGGRPSDEVRRLLVKPGLTGLWQVSGRANLPWHEAVRLDLYYVEN